MNTETLIKLPVQAAKPVATPALVTRLAEQFGAAWLDETTVEAWSREGGDAVVLLAGDPVQFPEGLDVAVVLPELIRAVAQPVRIGVVPREREDALARRYGSQRWPSLLFLRDGQYVTTLAGMHDWDVYVERFRAALAAPVSRVPGIGIPLVSATAGGASCH